MIDNSFGQGYVCHSVSNTLELDHQLLMIIDVLAVQEVRLQRIKVAP